MRMKFKGLKGFTSVEMMLTLIILSLLTFLSLPALTTLGKKLEVDSFLLFLQTDLIFAQECARCREEDVIVCFDNFLKEIKIFQGGNFLRKTALPKKYSLTSNYLNNRIIFHKTGQVKGGTINLWDGQELVGRLVIQVASGFSYVKIN